MEVRKPLRGFILAMQDTSRAVAAAIRSLCTLFVLVFDFAIGYNSRRFALQGVKHTDYPRGGECAEESAAFGV